MAIIEIKLKKVNLKLDVKRLQDRLEKSTEESFQNFKVARIKSWKEANFIILDNIMR